MRVDLFLKKVGILRRKEAKEAEIWLGERRIKPSYKLKGGELLKIVTRNMEIKIRVLGIPSGNVRKNERKNYVEIVEKHRMTVKEERDEFLKWLFED